MRLLAPALACAVLVAAQTSANAMTVEAFLTAAQALQQRGMLLALMSPEYGRLKTLMIDAGGSWKAQAGSARPAVCAPPHATLDRDQVMAIMRAVPPAARASTDAQSAVIAALNARYRCR